MNKIFFTALGVSLCFESLWATTLQWTESDFGGGPRWYNAGYTNWVPCFLPTASDEAHFYTITYHDYVTVNGNYVAGTLQLDSSTNVNRFAPGSSGDSLSPGIINVQPLNMEFSVPLDLSIATVVSPLTFNLSTGVTVNITGGITDDSTTLAGVTFAGSGTVSLNSVPLMYTGATTIGSGITVQTQMNNLLTGSPFIVDGTLDLQTYQDIIGNLTGTGNITIGTASILTVLSEVGAGTFDGHISGAGELIVRGLGTLSLTNTQTFTGGTVIGPIVGGVHKPGTLALSLSGSLYNLGTVTINDLGTFDIQDLFPSTTIGDLTGSGKVLLSSNKLTFGTLTSLTTYGGIISGIGGSLEKQGSGTAKFTGSSTYSGTTTISLGTFQAGATNAFSPNSDFIVNDTTNGLDLNNLDNQIKSLSGVGNVLTGTGAGGILTITNGGSFTGNISQKGGLTLSGGTLLLAGTANDYSGPTSIIGGTLTIGAIGALSPSSVITVSSAGTLDFGTFDNFTLGSISRTLTSSGTVTNEGKVSFPAISITGGHLTNTGTKLMGDPVLSSTISVSGGMVTNGVSTNISTSQLGNINAAVSLTGGTIENNAAILCSTYAQGASSTLQLGFFGNAPAADSVGTVTGTGLMSLNGNLVLKNQNGIQPTAGTTLLLISTPGVLSGTFTTAAGSGFSNPLIQPQFVYSSNSVSVNFLASPLTDFVWNQSATGVWSTAANWTPAGPPNTAADKAIFYTTAGIGSPVKVDGNFAVGALSFFGTTAYTIQANALGDKLLLGGGAPSPQIFLSTTADQTISVPLVLQGNASIYIDSLGGKLIINGNISEAALHSLTIAGNGEVDLGGTNSYTGATFIDSGINLYTLSVNSLAPLSALTLNSTATLDLNNFANTIYSLNGSGTVLTGGSSGILTISNGGSFTGNITPAGSTTQAGGLILTGGNLTLTPTVGLNAYTGSTQISSGATLIAGNISALANASAFTVAGTLDLQNHNNTIGSLTGAGTIKTGTVAGGILTIANGGSLSFTGQIQENGGLTLSAGSLLLAPASGSNSYSGITTISAGTLEAVNSGALSASSAFDLNGATAILKLDANNTIASLKGVASSVVNLGSSILTISGGGPATTFAGLITNLLGGLTIDGGASLILTGTDNYYSGPTSIINGTLTIGANGALSPSSAITVSPAGTLDFGTFANPVLGPNVITLTSSGTVTNEGQVIIPTISVTGGTLTNTGTGTILRGDISGTSTISISGGTVTNGGIVTKETSQLGNDLTSLSLTGGTLENNATILCSTYTQGAGATLQLGFFGEAPAPDVIGTVKGFDTMSLNGHLVVKYLNGPQPTSAIPTVLMETTGVLSGTFTTATGSGFTDPLHQPQFIYSANNVSVKFSSSLSTDFVWISPVTNVWSTAANWTSGGPPSTSAHKAIFSSNFGVGSPVRVDGDFSVGALSFFATIPYTIQANVSGNKLLLGGGAPSPQIFLSSTTTANQTISVPLVLQGDASIFIDSSTGKLIINGNISEAASVSYSLTIEGDGEVDLGGTNSYTGPTLIDSGINLHTLNENSLAPQSALTLNSTATLFLDNVDNEIDSLSGSGKVSTGTGAGGTLSIADGGSFDGYITGNGGIDLTGGTLLLNPPTILNDYSGITTISNSAILQAGTIYALSPHSIFTLQDAAQLQVLASNSIRQLLGGDDTIVTLSTGATLYIAGGNFEGAITGAGGITCLLGELLLSNANTSYTGATTINPGATLTLTGGAGLSDSNSFVVNGKFDITDIDSACLITGNLSGAATGDIEIAGKELRLGAGSGTFLGSIHGVDGSLFMQGDGITAGTLILTPTGSAANDYSGTTSIGFGTIQAGIANAFSPESAYIVNDAVHGLDLNNFDNQILSLSGDGIVKTGTGAGGILTISGVSSFAGDIAGMGGITLISGASLTLKNPTSFQGPATIDLGAELALTEGGRLYSLGSIIVDGVFDIQKIPSATTIGDLTGSGVVKLGANELLFGTTNTPIIFGGSIQGTGGSIEKQGSGTVNFTGSSTYSGTTTISLGTFQAGAINAFSPNSEFIVNVTTNGLDLNNYNNQIKSLSGAGAVNTGAGAGGILAISGESTFDGHISGTGGITLNSGAILTLTNTNTFAKPATISSGAQLVLTGSGQLLNTGSVVVNGVFDIQGITSSTTIGDLSGSPAGVVKLGDKDLKLGTAATKTFSGGIQGTGGTLEKLGTGTLVLGGSSKNTYTGLTTISAGTLQAGVVNGFASLSAHTVGASGTLDLNNKNNQIGSLDGAGAVLTGDVAGGILTITNGGLFTGNITQNGGLTLAGGILTLTPSSSNSYLKPTQISSGAALIAGNISALANASAFTVAGTLDLQNYNNTIGSLTGAGTIKTGTVAGGILTVANGGSLTYTGQIQENGGLTLSAGTLLLAPASGSNSYSGTTTISAGTLEAGNSGALSASSAFDLNGATAILKLDANNTIASLTGVASSVVNLGSSILTIGGGVPATIFAGQITNLCGGLTIDGGSSLTLTGTANDYCGPTSIIDGTLTIGQSGALSPNSAITVSSAGILDFGTFFNPIVAPASITLTSSGTVINQGQISIRTISITDGQVTNTGAGTILQGETSVSSTITVSGGIVTNGGIVIKETSQLGNDQTSLSLTGGKIENNATILCSTYTQGALSTLQLGFFGNTASTFDVGTVTGTGTMSLDGNLVVKWLNGTQPTSGGKVLLSTTPGFIQGKFTSATGSGFTDPDYPPRFVYSLHDVSMYFGGASSEWIYPGDGNWGNSSNWNPQNVPGVQGNTDDVAIFDYVFAPVVPFITVTLADSSGTAPQSVTLNQMIFNNADTSYTIDQFSNQGTITFDSTSGTPEIQAISGTHTINAPIQLNKDTDLILSDDAQLTFGSSMTLQSTAAAAFNVIQSVGTGTGKLVNDGVMSPYVMSFTGGVVDNNNLINPLTGLTIGATSGTIPVVLNNYSDVTPSGICTIGGSGSTTVSNIEISATIQPVGELLISGAGSTTLENSGTSAILGPSGNASDFTISASGSVTVLNDGADAQMGPSGKDADFNISPDSGGVATLTNSGAGAEMGSFGAKGNFNVGGAGTVIISNIGPGMRMGAMGDGGSMTVGGAGGAVSIINSGLKSTLGAFGFGGSVTVNSGEITNSSGAIFQAGSGGSLNIAGGVVTNDLTSTVGSNLANLTLSGGLLDSSGDILAFDYVQSGASTLKLNLVHMPYDFGNVRAVGTAQLDSTLIVDALPNSNPAVDQIIDLIIANKGVTGTFSNVNYLNFPPTLIPSIIYTPTMVELIFTSTVPPGGGGGDVLPQIVSILADSVNILIERDLSDLHRRIKQRKPCVCEPIALLAENDLISSFSVITKAPRLSKKQSQVSQKVSEKPQDALPGRVYIGPINTFGSFNPRGAEQPGFGFNRIGGLVGFDYAWPLVGFGLAVDYSLVDAKVLHNPGHMAFDQIHGSFYGTFVPARMRELAISTIVGGAYDWYSLKRKAGPSIAPEKAHAKSRGFEFDAFLGMEYIFSNDQFDAFPEHFNFTPIANVQYINTRVETICEHGAGIYDLKVKVPKAKILWSTLGARLDYLLQSEHIAFRPELDFGWRYQYLNQNYNVDFSTLELPQTKNVTMPFEGVDHNTLWVGVDFLITVCKAFQIETSYDFQWNKLFMTHNLYVGIGAEF